MNDFIAFHTKEGRAENLVRLGIHRSPPVLMTRISTLASGQRCSILRFTQFAWAKASTLPRVPIRIVRVARSIFRLDRKAS